MSPYKLFLIDPSSPFDHELCLFLEDVSTDIEAIEESEAQMDLMSCEGGIPNEEKWSGFLAKLIKDNQLIWQDYLQLLC